ncbi:MAG TPA: LamB/YcsF family protein [Polyangiaceae bacterium]
MLLNIDLGELPREPESLYACAQIANVACGGHAGDEASMTRAVELCRLHGAALGAHPSYPDREGFGRRPMSLDPAALRVVIAEQCERLAAVARQQGAVVAFVKAHGALYHATKEASVSEALVEGATAALGGQVAFLGPNVGALAPRVALAGLRYLREGFADRGMRADGSLVPRGDPGALVSDPVAAAAQAVAIAASGAADTICVHGDGPNAEAVARAVRTALDALAR